LKGQYVWFIFDDVKSIFDLLLSEYSCSAVKSKNVLRLLEIMPTDTSYTQVFSGLFRSCTHQETHRRWWTRAAQQVCLSL